MCSRVRKILTTHTHTHTVVVQRVCLCVCVIYHTHTYGTWTQSTAVWPRCMTLTETPPPHTHTQLMECAHPATSAPHDALRCDWWVIRQWGLRHTAPPVPYECVCVCVWSMGGGGKGRLIKCIDAPSKTLQPCSQEDVRVWATQRVPSSRKTMRKQSIINKLGTHSWWESRGGGQVEAQVGRGLGQVRSFSTGSLREALMTCGGETTLRKFKLKYFMMSFQSEEPIDK